MYYVRGTGLGWVLNEEVKRFLISDKVFSRKNKGQKFTLDEE